MSRPGSNANQIRVVAGLDLDVDLGWTSTWTWTILFKVIAAFPRVILLQHVQVHVQVYPGILLIQVPSDSDPEGSLGPECFAGMIGYGPSRETVSRGILSTSRTFRPRRWAKLRRSPST